MDSRHLTRAIMRFPLVEYLVDHGADELTPGEWVMLCPGCGKDKLTISIAKRAWHCWKCETADGVGRGGLVHLVQLLDGGTKREAVARILQGFHDSVSLDQLDVDLAVTCWEAGQTRSRPIDLPASCRQGVIDSTGIMPYCQKRGLSFDDVRDFGLLWCSEGRYGGRIVFPVWEGDILVYWQARAMWEEAENPTTRYIKALNPPKTSGAAGSSDVLFNLDRAACFPRVVITEGPIDAIHVGSDAVCSFGKRLAPAQVGKLLRAGVRAVDLLWDGPTAREPRGAWPEMWATAMKLVGLFDVRLIFLPQGDPGDYTREQLHDVRRNCARRLDDGRPTLMEI